MGDPLVLLTLEAWRRALVDDAPGNHHVPVGRRGDAYDRERSGNDRDDRKISFQLTAPTSIFMLYTRPTPARCPSVDSGATGRSVSRLRWCARAMSSAAGTDTQVGRRLDRITSRTRVGVHAEDHGRKSDTSRLASTSRTG